MNENPHEAVDATTIFSGGVAVITGAGRGIGEAIARKACRLGMQVVLVDAAEDRVSRVADELTAIDFDVEYVVIDVGDYVAVQDLAERVFQKFGHVRLLVNNAGIATAGLLWEISDERWDAMLRVNLSGVFNGIAAFVPRMLRSGEVAFVVNTSSTAAFRTTPLAGPYHVSKHGVEVLSECLHHDLNVVGSNIHVAALAPGNIDTQFYADAAVFDAPGGHLGEDRRDEMRQRQANGGLPAEVVAETLFEGLAKGDFLITTHPKVIDELISKRAHDLTRRVAPVAPTQQLT
jgi:NAD(P)-dependent dehydrogenase (short-subunit alcohol dehydrogenase family)